MTQVPTCSAAMENLLLTCALLSGLNTGLISLYKNHKYERAFELGRNDGIDDVDEINDSNHGLDGLWSAHF